VHLDNSTSGNNLALAFFDHTNAEVFEQQVIFKGVLLLESACAVFKVAQVELIDEGLDCVINDIDESDLLDHPLCVLSHNLPFAISKCFFKERSGTQTLGEAKASLN